MAKNRTYFTCEVGDLKSRGTKDSYEVRVLYKGGPVPAGVARLRSNSVDSNLANNRLALPAIR